MKLKSLKIGIFCLMLPCFALAQNDAFTIKGKINASHDGDTIFFIFPNGKTVVKDSTIIKGGLFTLTGKISIPGVSYMRLGKIQPANSLDFYLSSGEVDITTTTDSLKDATIDGNQLAKDYARMMIGLRPILKGKMSYYAQFRALPPDQRKGPEAKEIALKIQGVNKDALNYLYNFIDQNPDSYLSLDYLEKSAGSLIDYDVIMPKFNKLNDNLKNSEKGKAFYDRIVASQGAKIGAIAKDFESVTPDGKKLSLKEVESTGKYTLIDFWASWCGPCRAENPNVVNAYGIYHDKGLNILSVSLDTKAESWKAAIAKDGMPWNHVSSLLGWKEPAALLYGVHAIPQNVLVDSNGVVVAKNLRGDELLAKLKELFM